MLKEQIVNEIHEIIKGHYNGEDSMKRLAALSDAIRNGEYDAIIPQDDITLDDVDRMALETLTMEGEITVREDSPEVPSVGWPGSDATEGEITGRFEVPASSIIMTAIGPMFIFEDAGEPDTVLYWIEAGPLGDKIEAYCINHVIIYRPELLVYKPDIEITGVTKKGDRAVIEFKVVLK